MLVKQQEKNHPGSGSVLHTVNIMRTKKKKVITRLAATRRSGYCKVTDTTTVRKVCTVVKTGKAVMSFPYQCLDTAILTSCPAGLPGICRLTPLPSPHNTNSYTLSAPVERAHKPV